MKIARMTLGTIADWPFVMMPMKHKSPKDGWKTSFIDNVTFDWS